MILRLDAFSKKLPSDIPNGNKFRSYIGVFLSLLFYLALAVMALWLLEIIATTGLDFGDNEEPELGSDSQQICLPKHPH